MHVSPSRSIKLETDSSVRRRRIPSCCGWPLVAVSFLVFAGLHAEVIVVVRLTLEVCGVMSTDSEGREKSDVSPPLIVSGLSGISSSPRHDRSPGRHFHL